jgi:hypothetical protein
LYTENYHVFFYCFLLTFYFISSLIVDFNITKIKL